MRDTSEWSGDFRADKPVMSIEVRGRYPNFNWHDGAGTFYAIQSLGETWGDSPGTVKEYRERGLPTRFRYGGFVVAGDSAQLVNGNILRVTSLRAGNQGNTTWHKEITQPSHLTSMVTSLTYSNPPRAWTGIGLGEHSLYPVANLFFIRGSDNRLCYRTYTSGSGWTGAVLYSGSPTFDLDGVGIAPVTHAEGYIYTYNPTGHLVVLHHFDNGVWTYQAMPMRYGQHPLNGHWFDAVAIGSERLVTFCVNGVQYATWHTPGIGFRDPWPVIAFDPEFGGAQTRICKLTTVGSRIVATAWSRFAGSSDDYEVSYTHLIWSDDGVNWALPEEGYIGQTACRGKLHTLGDTAYVIGASVSYVGDAVTWLGGDAQTQTTVAANAVGQNLVQDLDRASDLKLPLLIADSFDKSLLQYGNEVVYRLAPLGEPPIDMAHLTLDTPGVTLDGVGQSMQMVSRGPLKKLISFTAPLDQTISGPQISYQDFRQGGVYARWGVWNTDEQGFAYCDRYDDSNALATVGIQYGGPFQLLTRVRLTKYVGNNIAGVVFWYEGPEDYYRVDLTADTVYLRRIEAGVRTDLAMAAFSMAADAWCHVLLQYFRGGLRVYVRPQGGSWSEALTFSNWIDPEPLRWYAGLFCSLPRTVTTQTVELDATHKVAVAATHRFPTGGEILVASETIGYSTTTGTQFGSGQPYSLIRGVRSQRVSHPEGTPVYLDGCRFEADRFGVIQVARPMSIADVCAQVVTTTGAPFRGVQVVDDSETGARVFPQVHGHGWVASGEYSGTFKLQFWCNTTNPP
ncbi:MAG: hypothetical protein KDA37_13560, partial [Planctomycetales bacterium]|nr:hypothetical protein [Planctomycetales bacterium]